MCTKTTAVLLWVLVLAAGARDGVKEEAARLQGEWSMVSGEADGQPLPAESVKGWKRVARGGVTTVTVDGRVLFKATFTVDPASKPRAINYAMTEGPTKGQTHLGIYKLDGDTVEFCVAAPGTARPTEFTAPAGSQRILSVWKRDKK
jgi:uncharacterized protein (TIGR03067 family)